MNKESKELYKEGYDAGYEAALGDYSNFEDIAQHLKEDVQGSSYLLEQLADELNLAFDGKIGLIKC